MDPSIPAPLPQELIEDLAIVHMATIPRLLIDDLPTVVVATVQRKGEVIRRRWGEVLELTMNALDICEVIEIKGG